MSHAPILKSEALAARRPISCRSRRRRRWSSIFADQTPGHPAYNWTLMLLFKQCHVERALDPTPYTLNPCFSVIVEVVMEETNADGVTQDSRTGSFFHFFVGLEKLGAMLAGIDVSNYCTGTSGKRATWTSSSRGMTWPGRQASSKAKRRTACSSRSRAATSSSLRLRQRE